jgi:tape measure domain-containing protein
MILLFSDASSAISNIEKKLTESTDKMLEASKSVDKLNDTLKDTGKNASSVSSKLKKYFNKETIMKGMNIADEFTNTSERLNFINDGSQTQEELQDKVFAAADRSMGSYSDTADFIGKMGSAAGDTFQSNDELIAFTELMNKSFRIDGSSTQNQQTTMDQLTQSMDAGKMQEDGFSSIMQNAPMIADAIAEYTGKSKEELMKLASEGLITSDIIKNAMLMAGTEINEQFEGMPMTFADVWNEIKNAGLQALGPIIGKVNELMKSDSFNNLMYGVTVGINLISLAIGGLIDFVVSNWPLIQSVLIATGIYLAATLGPKFIATGIAALKSGYMAATGWGIALAPMLMIIGILALLLYGLIEAGVTFEDVFGVIGGIVGMTVAAIWNLSLGLFEFILGLINFLVNPFIDIANFIGNVFTNPVSSVIYLFQGMADRVLAFLEKIASALDFVFGSKMADTVANWRSGLKGIADTAVKELAPDENYQKVMDNLDLSASDFGLNRKGYKESGEAGDGKGREILNKLKSNMNKFTGSQLGKEGKTYDPTGFQPERTSYEPTIIEGIGSGGAVEVDMPNEDIKYLRDIAERDYINKFNTATLAPNISVQFGDVHETADADAVAGRIKTILQEEIVMTAEGAY